MSKKNKLKDALFSYDIEDPDIPPGLYDIGMNITTSKFHMIPTSQKVLEDEVAIVLSAFIGDRIRFDLSEPSLCAKCEKKL